ncbi:hypothetical protein COCSUDRAFT_65576 [Coccomyxa subellipsoidea C-169]|uniref:Uncharacterized protein n=1 Tax=Coccomyxa subellipsoidea (strain C-169) TaxID=574566 RepID=I0Z2L1_COCSC|nr:hypothetical protein COCSUDRAFT_65576 [Coccomyxa subellipsoidea C-169]EIE24880.1 hypothetical protein COCSUDRAFT_65576 [Coccomyxa subellipsoidea C-169]|eukprot:XP_005649424.1 hypothetical protein COCSUDRAFT_65576 [Coccomyxa subellipsoidea C-169]
MATARRHMRAARRASLLGRDRPLWRLAASGCGCRAPRACSHMPTCPPWRVLRRRATLRMPRPGSTSTASSYTRPSRSSNECTCSSSNSSSSSSSSRGSSSQIPCINAAGASWAPLSSGGICFTRTSRCSRNAQMRCRACRGMFGRGCRGGQRSSSRDLTLPSSAACSMLTTSSPAAPASQHQVGGSGQRSRRSAVAAAAVAGGLGGGSLLDHKAVLRGQRWKLPRVRSLGSLPSDDALLAQAATWPERRSTQREGTAPPQPKPATEPAQQEAANAKNKKAAASSASPSDPLPAPQANAHPSGQQSNATAQHPAEAPTGSQAGAPAEDPSAIIGLQTPAKGVAPNAVDPPASDGSASLRGLRIRPLDISPVAAAAAGNSNSTANANNISSNVGGGNSGAADTASPVSHGSLNAFNPFEGGSEFSLSPLRRGGDHRGDNAGAQGSPPAHSAFSPFGLVAELRFTPTPPLEMGAPLETGQPE